MPEIGPKGSDEADPPDRSAGAWIKKWAAYWVRVKLNSTLSLLLSPPGLERIDPLNRFLIRLNGGEGQVRLPGPVILAPLLKQAAVAEGDVVPASHAKPSGGVVDPGRRTFELGVVADGSLVDDTMPFPIAPLGAPFFVAEGGDQPKREEDLLERGAVGDVGFSFNAMLVRVDPGAAVREPFVSNGPAAGIVANAQDLGARAHLSVGRVVEHVALKTARSQQRESCPLEAPGETGQVIYCEFYLGLDRHGR